MGTPLGPKYIPYTYMDRLGLSCSATGLLVRDAEFRLGQDCAPLVVLQGFKSCGAPQKVHVGMFI